jgi:hypothetical protein
MEADLNRMETDLEVAPVRYDPQLVLPENTFMVYIISALADLRPVLRSVNRAWRNAVAKLPPMVKKEWSAFNSNPSDFVSNYWEYAAYRTSRSAFIDDKMPRLLEWVYNQMQNELLTRKSASAKRRFARKMRKQLDAWLLEAAAGGHVDAMLFCVEHGADASTETLDGVLLESAINGWLTAAVLCLNMGACAAYAALAVAVVAPRNSIKMMILCKDYIGPGLSVTCGTASASINAASNNRLQELELLAKWGVCDFHRAIKAAACYGHAEAMRVCMTLGASSVDFDAVLIVATAGGYDDIARLAIYGGATAFDEAMCICTTLRRVGSIMLLLECGATNVDKCMIIAAEYGFLDLVQFFKQQGATSYSLAGRVAEEFGHADIAGECRRWMGLPA